MRNKTKLRKIEKIKKKEIRRIKARKEEREYNKVKKLSAPKGVTIKNKNLPLPEKTNESN